MVADLNRGYYLLFIDGGKRANAHGEAEGAIGVILREPDCGEVLDSYAEKVGTVESPQEAEYRALIRGLELAAEKKIRYIAVFSDSANVVNQMTDRWGKSGRAMKFYEEAKELLTSFSAWQLSWIPREMTSLSIKPSKASPCPTPPTDHRSSVLGGSPLRALATTFRAPPKRDEPGAGPGSSELI